MPVPQEVEPFLLRPLSTGQAWFFASVGLTLALAAIYEHARRKETPQAVGLGLAAAGLFLWAGLRGPTFYILIIISVGLVVPWLIWGRKARAIRAALLARSPIVIQRRKRPPAPVVGSRGLLDYKRDGIRALNAITDVLTKMTKEMNRYQKRMPRHTRHLQRAIEREASAEREYRLTEKAARDIEAHANEMGGLERRLQTAREMMISNYTEWLRSQSGRSGGDEVRLMIRTLGKAASEGRKGAVTYHKVVAELRGYNINVPVNRATDQLSEVLSKIVQDIRAIERFCQTQGRSRSPRARPP